MEVPRHAKPDMWDGISFGFNWDVWKGEALESTMKGDRMNTLSLMFKTEKLDFFYCQLGKLVSTQHLVSSLQLLNKLLLKPVGGGEKPLVPFFTEEEMFSS